MRVADLAYETALSFNSNRARSALTILGIVIGIAAVIAMTSLIGGIKQSLMVELGLEQARLVYISYYGNNGMQLSDVDAMQADLAEDFDYLTPTSSGYVDSVVSDTQKKPAMVTGVMPEYASAMGLKLLQGRFLNEEECKVGALSVVLDQPGVRLLFGNKDAEVAGKKVRIDSVDYLIVGVVESLQAGASETFQLYMPLKTLGTRINGRVGVDQVLGFAREGSDMDAIAAELKRWMTKHFNLSDEDAEGSMWIQTMQSIIDQVNQMVASFQMLMVTVASISLVVGGIGIMNMMLTNVTERIREIGLRKALGAKRADITSQFLLESIVLCLIGGVLGVVLGYVGSFALSGLMGSFAEAMAGTAEITPVIDPTAVVFATLVCVGIGVVFGYYPARRAARLDPVESLHYQ